MGKQTVHVHIANLTYLILIVIMREKQKQKTSIGDFEVVTVEEKLEFFSSPFVRKQMAESGEMRESDCT